MKDAEIEQLRAENRKLQSEERRLRAAFRKLSVSGVFHPDKFARDILAGLGVNQAMQRDKPRYD